MNHYLVVGAILAASFAVSDRVRPFNLDIVSWLAIRRE